MITEFLKRFKTFAKKTFRYFFPGERFKDSPYWKKPVFQSSFIQYWDSRYWSLERWEKELAMLKDIGITEIILQFIADTKEKYAVYFSEIEGFAHGDIDMLETALNAADKKGISVRVGLGLNDDWWRRSAKESFLKAEAEVNKAIIDEVAGKYGHHPSFKGWFIPHEFYQFSAYTKKQYGYLNNFYRELASEIKNKLPREIMVSAYHYGKSPWILYLTRWKTMLQTVLKETGIDILALQDGIGANFNSIRQLPIILEATGKAVRAVNIKFFVVAETFTSTYSGFKGAPIKRIEEQLIMAKGYADGFAAFSINHYQNRSEINQSTNYDEYHEYYLENK